MFNPYSNNFPKYSIETVTNGYMVRIEWRAEDENDSPARSGFGRCGVFSNTENDFDR